LSAVVGKQHLPAKQAHGLALILEAVADLEVGSSGEGIRVGADRDFARNTPGSNTVPEGFAALTCKITTAAAPDHISPLFRVVDALSGTVTPSA